VSGPKPPFSRIAFIGLGEAADAFIEGWGSSCAFAISAYDIKSDHPERAAEIADRAARLGIANCFDIGAAVAEADLVFSTVTADQALNAAVAAAPHVPKSALYCDLNSCAPEEKRRAAALIEAAGARYLDVAVMAPVHPKRNLVPCLASGPTAAPDADRLRGLPMDVRYVGAEVGRASAIKLVRSIMVKGLEALTAECALAAVAADVADEVFPSLKSGHTGLDVPERAAYNFERSLLHGARRAAEMDGAAAMLEDLGLPGGMSRASADWQRHLARIAPSLPDIPNDADHLWFVRAILAAWDRARD